MMVRRKRKKYGSRSSAGRMTDAMQSLAGAAATTQADAMERFEGDAFPIGRLIAAQREHWRQQFAGGLQEPEGEGFWFPLQAPPQSEFVVMLLLSGAGVPVWTPTERKWRGISRFSSDKRQIVKPMFGGLIFAWSADAKSLFAAMRERGVVDGEIHHVDRVAKLTRDEFRAFYAAVEGRSLATHERFQRSHREFTAGERVRFSQGPLEAVEGVVEAIAGAEAILACEFFGGATRMRVRMRELEPAS